MNIKRKYRLIEKLASKGGMTRKALFAKKLPIPKKVDHHMQIVPKGTVLKKRFPRGEEKVREVLNRLGAGVRTHQSEKSVRRVARSRAGYMVRGVLNRLGLGVPS